MQCCGSRIRIIIDADPQHCSCVVDPDPNWIRIQPLCGSKTFFHLSFNIDNITLDSDLETNWAKIQDPDPNSIYLDPQSKIVFVRRVWSL